LDTVRSKAPLLGHLIGVACEGTGAAVGALVGGGSTIPLAWAGDHPRARQIARAPTVREVASDGMARLELGPDAVPNGFLAAQPVATAGAPAVLYVAGGRVPDIERVRLLLRALAAAIERRLRLAADPETMTAPLGVTIADARYSHTPLVFVDGGFCRMTGYEPGELHGWSAAFLQGSQRDQAGRWRLQGAVARGEACTATLQNFRRDGRRFTNRVALTPVHADDGALTHFVAVVAESPETESAQPILGGAAVDPVHTLAMSPVAKLVIDPGSARVRFANHDAGQLLGQRARDLRGWDLPLPRNREGPLWLRRCWPLSPIRVEITVAGSTWGSRAALVARLLDAAGQGRERPRSAVLRSRRDGAIARASEPAADLLGRSRDEMLVLSTGALEAGGPASPAMGERNWDFLRIQCSMTVETRLQRRDGWSLHVVLAIQHVDADGEAVCHVVLREMAAP